MKKLGVVLLGLMAVFFSACSGSSNDKIEPQEKLYNMAAERYGAVAISEADSDNLENLIDQDEDTFWLSESDTPVTIELENVEELVLVEVFGEDLPTTISSPSPDLLIEFSEDGDEFLPADATLYLGEFVCAGSSRSAERIACLIDPAAPIKFIRITSQNDNFYSLSSVNAFAYKL